MSKYPVKAFGHNGEIDLTVDVEDRKINDISVDRNAETPAIFKQVFGKLKDTILEEQSFKIDAIAGASQMTQSILDSADKVVKEQGYDFPAPVRPAKKERTLTTDVLVVGSGGAGLVAACRALSLGKRVVLVEKNGYLGGATLLNGSNVTATGSKTAKEIFGAGADQDSPERLVDDIARECEHTNYPELSRLLANNIGAAIDFIADFADLDYQKAQTQTPEHSVQRQIELPSSSSYEFITKVASAFERKGGTILTDCRVEGLLQDADGTLTGLWCEGKDGKAKIYAKSVILASGGYGAKAYNEGWNEGVDYYGPLTATGDSYTFTKGLHLKAHDLDWYKVYPHGLEVEPGIAKLTTYASKLATDMGALYVNQNGQRIVNESDVYTTLRNQVLKQPGRVAYLLMDQRTWDEVYKLLVLHDFSAQEIAGYLASDGKKRPTVVKGSLQEVAQKAGVNPAGLAKTVADYQGYAAQGNDPEFGRAPEFLHQFEGDTFYLIEQRDRFATSLGGYMADESMHLLNKDNQPVAHLYGAGEVVGGANGHDSMPSMMNSWSFASGFVAGTSAARD
ncbi:FAD-dependent oxidoreductase [Limosilactobacillus fermentum]|uniref:FAD-dependent oxidoreductase n=1 Tax=Limosilactobacillus fermentum TaxID=1613 RepID=UPI0034634939